MLGVSALEASLCCPASGLPVVPPWAPNHVAETLTETEPETEVNDVVTDAVETTRNRTHEKPAIQEDPGRLQEDYQEANHFCKGWEQE